MKSSNGFRITDGKGFHVTFENGYTVSVQFGPGNYAGNYNAPFRSAPPKGGWESRTAETAVWGPDGEMLGMVVGSDGSLHVSTAGVEDEGYVDTVQGHQSPASVLALLNWASQQVTP